MKDSVYKQQVTDAFDESAKSYDRSGVEFFTPMGERLVGMAAPAAGDRVLDVGCGRGACIFPAADLVGPHGSVLGIDIAPGMIEQTQRECEKREIENVRLRVMDAESPDLPKGSLDLVLGSYSFIFLPQAIETLGHYHGLLSGGGRIAFTSPVFKEGVFPFLPPEFTPLIPRSLLDHLPPAWRPEALVQRFNSWLERPDDLARTLAGQGFDEVHVVDEPVLMTAGSVGAWVDWSHTQGMRLLWQNLPEAQSVELRERLIEGLGQYCDASGRLSLDVPVRFVLARAVH